MSAPSLTLVTSTLTTEKISEISSAVIEFAFKSAYLIVSIFVITLPIASSTESDSVSKSSGSIFTPEVSVEYLPTSSIIFALISSMSAEKLSTSPVPTFSFKT